MSALDSLQPREGRWSNLYLFGVEVHVYGEPLVEYLTKLNEAPHTVTGEESALWRPMTEACGAAMNEVQMAGRVPELLEIHGCGINSVPTPENGYARCWPKKYHEYEELRATGRGDMVREVALAQFASISKFHYWPPKKPFVKMPDRFWAE